MPTPRGWVSAQVGDVADFERGIAFPSSDKRHEPGNGLVACLRTANVQEEVTWDDLWFIPEHHVRSSTKLLRLGDIVISTANSQNLVGKVARVGEIPTTATLGAFISVIRVRPELSSEFIFYKLRTSEAQAALRASASQTTNIANISAKQVLALSIDVPPVNEQRRIVAKLDAIFAQSRTAKARLERLPALLEKLKRSVLAAAFRGDLTADWRARHPDVEPASITLERTRTERRHRWEAELRTKGKNPAKARFVQPAPDLQTVPQSPLPPTWVRASVADVAECLDSRRVPVSRDERNRRSGSYPYYGANGQVGSIDGFLFDDELVLVTEDETFYGRVKPIAYRVSGKCWVNNHAHVLRSLGAIGPDLICFALMHYRVEPWLSGTTGRAKLTQADLMRLPIALPPIAEAQEIEVRLRRTFSAINALRTRSAHALASFEALERAALAKAFRGELVEHDPNDEPASVLLERQRSARAEEAKAASRKASRVPVTATKHPRRSAPASLEQD